jgi:hypothetical protein
MNIETQNFFDHKIKVKNVEESRIEYFKSLCKCKSVLHVGCADAMFYNKEYNLHAQLKDDCYFLDGLDPDKEALSNLQADVPGTYFNDITEVNKSYDIILVPEVIEHILNLEGFFDKLFSLNFKELYITAPNIIHYVKEMKYEDDYFFETVHPDHKYWFSPYTLYSCLKSYLKEDNFELFLLENKSMIGIKIRKI